MQLCFLDAPSAKPGPGLCAATLHAIAARACATTLRFGVAIAFVLATVPCADVALGCSVCGCCRITQYDDPISPYIYGEHPLYTGQVEVTQSAPILGGAGHQSSLSSRALGRSCLMPDTQIYAESYPQHFNAQTQFLKDNAAALNLKYVLHEGDIVNVAAATGQWTNSRTALDKLNGFVPYALAPGNHDYGGQGAIAPRYLITALPGRITSAGERPTPRSRPSAVSTKETDQARPTTRGTRSTRVVRIGLCLPWNGARAMRSCNGPTRS